ncbi:hypothetical protein VTN96DRAFT_629 [Rasamsonia emersonii]
MSCKGRFPFPSRPLRSRIPVRSPTFTSSRSQARLPALPAGFVSRIPVRSTTRPQAPLPAPAARFVSRLPVRSATFSAESTSSRPQARLPVPPGFVSRLPVPVRRASPPTPVAPSTTVTPTPVTRSTLSPRLEARRAARENRPRPWLPRGPSVSIATTARPAPSALTAHPEDNAAGPSSDGPALSSEGTDSAEAGPSKRVSWNETLIVVTVDRWIVPSRHIWPDPGG